MAAGKFNSSPVLGELPQAEGYEGYDTAAFRQASAWQLCLLGPFRRLGLCRLFYWFVTGVCLARCAFGVFRAF